MPSVSELERESTSGHRMDGIPPHGQHPLMDVVQELTARVKALEAERNHARNAYNHLRIEVEQALGKILSYPHLTDDPANWPLATEAEGVCVFEHTAETLVTEVGTQLAALKAERDRLLDAIRDVHAQHADDLCWMPADVNKIFVAAGLPPQDLRVGDTEAMRRNCDRYIACLQNGGPWISYAELEKERDHWRKLADENLEKTADGAFLVLCEHLYCPQCRGKVRQEYDLCYCDECGNPDCCQIPPLPLFYASTLAKP